jgi:hypothetical protein
MEMLENLQGNLERVVGERQGISSMALGSAADIGDVVHPTNPSFTSFPRK